MGRGRRSSLVRPTAVMALLGTPQGRQPQSSPRTESMADGSSTGLLGLPLGSRGTAAGGHTARRTRAPAAARLLPCVWSEREQGATRRLVLVQYVVPVVLVVGAVRKHAVCGGDLLHHSRPTITATLFPWLPPSLLCKLPPPSNTTLFLVKGMLLRPQWVSVVLPSPGSGARVENCYFSLAVRFTDCLWFILLLFCVGDKDCNKNLSTPLATTRLPDAPMSCFSPAKSTPLPLI